MLKINAFPIKFNARNMIVEYKHVLATFAQGLKRIKTFESRVDR